MAVRWTETDIPNQTGRVAIVTGANTGIGWETARALAQKGATVILACRNLQKANPAADQIRALNPAGQVVMLPLDLADLDSVRAFAAAFRQTYDRLDLLINNAGVMNTAYIKTPQGFEQQFATNHLGHFALTGLLLDLLNLTPGARVVTVSSSGHFLGVINFDDLNGEKQRQPGNGYAQSKLANLLFTYELQRKLTAAGQGTLAVACHPGWAATHMQHQIPRYLQPLNPLLAQSPAMGALPTLCAATARGISGGDYLGPGFLGLRGYPQKVKSSARSYDEAVARRLWSVSENLTQVSYHLEAARV